MICYVTINDLFLEFENIHGAKIGNIFEICKFYLKIIGNIKYNSYLCTCQKVNRLFLVICTLLA